MKKKVVHGFDKQIWFDFLISLLFYFDMYDRLFQFSHALNKNFNM